MRKPCITKSLTFIVMIISAEFSSSLPVQKSLKSKLNPHYLKAIAAYKRLESKLPKEELRALTTIGILNGAREAEQQMEEKLIESVRDLLFNSNRQDDQDILPKIDKIETQLERDQKALEILTSAMDLAMNIKDSKVFKKEMQDILKTIKKEEDSHKNTSDSSTPDIGLKVTELSKHIRQQIDMMKYIVDDKIDHTLDYVLENANENGVIAKASGKVLRKRHTDAEEEQAQVRQINVLYPEDDYRNNLIEISRNGKYDTDEDSLEDDSLLTAANNVIETNSDDKKLPNMENMNKAAVENSSASSSSNSNSNMTLAKQEEGSPEILDNGGGGGGGGLVGIITSLSGGEGGSDIGALIGALTGVISQIFGPGGLDIESLISSATSLISGLLAGNKNFGTVLGEYVGTAFDGLSGGGGAINNGVFIGNFLGTVVASLSADPEEDDVPPKPLVFFRSLISTFMEAKNRKGSGEETSEERKDKDKDKDGNNGDKGGSDSTAFIKHIVSHVVGGVVSLILNASLGASGGASHASHSLFSGSSAGSGGAHGKW